MQDADGYSFEEAGRALETSSPACRRGRKRSGPHAPNGHRICPMRMQNMTPHDISQGLLPALMTKHDIP